MKAERKRQIKKWGHQKNSLRIWAWIWLEEVGEYYQAKLDWMYVDGCYLPEELRNDDAKQHMRDEYIQVLTVIWAFASDWRPWHGLWRTG